MMSQTARNAGRSRWPATNAGPAKCAVTEFNLVCVLLCSMPSVLSEYVPLICIWIVVCGPCAKKADQGVQCIYTGEPEKKRAVQK